MIKNMVMESLNMPMVIDMKEIGKMEKDLIKATMSILMVMSMKGNGEMI